MPVKGRKEDLEKDFPDIYDSIFDNKDGSWTAYERAHTSRDTIARSAKIPHNVQMQRIIDRYNHADERLNPEKDSIRYAWLRYKEAVVLLREAVRRWTRKLPCRLWWHSMEPHSDFINGIKICRRCGAWREV